MCQAVLHNQLDIVRLLLESRMYSQRADNRVRLINLQDGKGWSALAMALHYRWAYKERSRPILQGGRAGAGRLGSHAAGCT